MPRFPLPAEPDQDGMVVIYGADAAHAAGSLRIRPGDRLAASRPGRLLELEVLEADSDRVVARVLYDAPQPAPPPVDLTLLVSLPKKRLMESIVEKVSEIGARALQPVVAERCIARMDDESAEAKLARWRRVAAESQKQCGRTEPLLVASPVSLADALQQGWDHLYVLHESAATILSATDAPGQGRVAALVGPEGGLTPAELLLATEVGGLVRRLPTYILKVDTAATAAAALLIAAPWGGGRG